MISVAARANAGYPRWSVVRDELLESAAVTDSITVNVPARRVVNSTSELRRGAAARRPGSSRASSSRRQHWAAGASGCPPGQGLQCPRTQAGVPCSEFGNLQIL